MLEYLLENNELLPDPNAYRAQPINVTSFSEADLINRVMDIGAGLTKSDVVSVVEALKQVITRIVAEGGTLNTELFNSSFSIKGVFTLTQQVDPHTVHLNLHPGSALRAAIQNISTRRIDNVSTGGLIHAVQDVKTGSLNDALTPDRDLRINGTKIKVTGEDAGIGVYFVNTADGARTKVDPTDIVTNNPSELMVVIPTLAAGTYNLQVVTQYSGAGRELVNPRVITLDKPLTVGAAP
jgi:hypothetical protein